MWMDLSTAPVQQFILTGTRESGTKNTYILYHQLRSRMAVVDILRGYLRNVAEAKRTQFVGLVHYLGE